MKLGLWLVAGELRSHPWRALAALAAIALGVALGLAVQLINGSAVAEFTQAVRAAAGQADLEIRGPKGGFDEAVFFRVAADPGVAVASPVLEVEALVLEQDGSLAALGARKTLRVLGLDVFRAARVSPELLGVPAAEDERMALLADDAVFLSPAAQAWLGLAPGGLLRLQVGLAERRLRVAGGVPGARANQRLAVMDLGAAQWRLAGLGRLSRIELRLASGADLESVRTRLAAALPAGVFAVAPETGDQRAASLSRAYRVNLNVLALVALFTGAFLVYSTQALTVVRRRGELALLRTLGWSRPALLAQILGEGALIGLMGSLLGAAGGIAAARAALAFFGGDLGGGYFAGVAPALTLDPLAVAGFLMLGTAAALAGSLAPALEIGRAAPAQALKCGALGATSAGLPGRLWPGLALLAAGGGLLALPPVAGLPVGGYLAIACWLVGGISLVPNLAGRAFARAAARLAPGAARRPLAFLSAQRLAHAPGQAGVALAGVVASFSLMVAMAIMVGSFRVSVDRWLDQVLVAPLHFRVPEASGDGFFGPETAAAIAAHPDVARTEWMRVLQVDLDPAQPPVTLMARPLDPAAPERRLPLTGTAPAELPPDRLPVWVSEAMVDLYGWTPGRAVTLPLAGQAVPAVVAGVWRDFARQHGTVALDLDAYQRLSGDTALTNGALWPRGGVPPAALVAELQRRLPATRGLEFAEPGRIREVTLRLFDRSFAVTYLLELVAIAIGLAGIGATFSAQTLARAREFGLLRHLGTSRAGLMTLLGLEAAGLTLFGVAAGGLLGAAIALVLIRVVNPQSFHWSMDLAVPWSMLALVTGLLLAAGVATALLATRQATGSGPLRAVREDW